LENRSLNNLHEIIDIFEEICRCYPSVDFSFSYLFISRKTFNKIVNTSLHYHEQTRGCITTGWHDLGFISTTHGRIYVKPTLDIDDDDVGFKISGETSIRSYKDMLVNELAEEIILRKINI